MIDALLFLVALYGAYMVIFTPRKPEGVFVIIASLVGMYYL